MNEAELQKKCISHAKSVGVYTINMIIDGHGNKGVPDLILCLNGDFVAVELKVGKNEPSNAQKIQMKRIRKSGGKTYVIRSLKEFKKLLGGN
ncbi:MAG: VRR-NUC domain-containing protein [archaeon]